MPSTFGGYGVSRYIDGLTKGRPDEPGPDSSTVHFETLGQQVPVMSNSPNQWTAARGMILRTEVGSTVHGTSIDSQNDRDEIGVCVEPPSAILGLSEVKHYTFRSAGEGERSRPGDLDLVVYGLRRFVGLAEAGNPTILLPLFVPDSAICYVDDVGRQLRANAPLFLSKAAGNRFRGYLQSQRKGLLGERSGGTRNQGRADIREKYGFDTKFAMHMVRLGLQGVEYLTTGRITLPIPEPDRTWLRDLRQGRHTLQEALDRARALDDRLEQLVASSTLPARPDRRRIDAFLVDTYQQWWARG